MRSGLYQCVPRCVVRCGSCLCVHPCCAGVASEWRGTALHVHACHGILLDFLRQIRSAALCPAERCLCFSPVRYEGCSISCFLSGHSTRDVFLSIAFTLVSFLFHFVCPVIPTRSRSVASVAQVTWGHRSAAGARTLCQGPRARTPQVLLGIDG